MTLTLRRSISNLALVGNALTCAPNEIFTSAVADVVVHRFDDASSALRAARILTVDDWFIQTQLPDMSGFDCMEMLQDLHASARYFLFASQYCDAEDRRAFQLVRTRYFALPLTAVLARQLLQPVRVDSLPEYETELRPQV